jgi:hypothetical protein
LQKAYKDCGTVKDYVRMAVEMLLENKKQIFNPNIQLSKEGLVEAISC